MCRVLIKLRDVKMRGDGVTAPGIRNLDSRWGGQLHAPAVLK